MPIHFSEEDGGRFLNVRVSGKLVKADYELFMPELERLVGLYQRLNVYVDMSGFQGWDMGGFWEELKGGLRYNETIHRCAVVGDRQWERAIIELSRPFTKADIKYFDHAGIAAAKKWLHDGG